MLLLDQISGGADVRGKHAFLDYLVRVVAGLGHDGLDLSVLIELEPKLYGLEVDRAAPGSRCGQHAVQGVELREMRQQSLRLARRRASLLREPCPDLRVGEARAGAHHRRIEPVAANAPLRVDRHVASHAQPIHVGLERTELVRQGFRKHGNHAAGKVH